MKRLIYLSLGILVMVLVFSGIGQSKPVRENITNIKDVERGSSVTLHGKVTRILDDDEFRLQDDTGSIRVYIGWRNRVMVRVNEKIKVRGFVDDDLVNTFRPEVYANELVREDGTVIKLN